MRSLALITLAMARFEKALAARAQGQNEYVRMGDVPNSEVPRR